MNVAAKVVLSLKITMVKLIETELKNKNGWTLEKLWKK